MVTIDICGRMSEVGVPGASLAVINDGRIDWARGYGLAASDADDKVDERTPFQAASISKMATAMVVMRLLESGILDLDEDVNVKLQNWHVPENEFTKERPVTLRRLLSHSAGTNAPSFMGYNSAEPMPSLAQVLDGLPPANTEAVRVCAVPGTATSYSGGGFCVVQQLLMDVTRMPFPQLMQQHLLDKLKMSHSTFHTLLPSQTAGPVAVGHRSDGTVIGGRWRGYPEMAAAGLWTTASDLALMAVALWESINGKAGSYLTCEAAKEMITKPISAEYSLGLRVIGEGASLRFTAMGVNPGYRAGLVMSMDSGQGAVVMTNSENGTELLDEILADVAQTYGWST